MDARHIECLDSRRLFAAANIINAGDVDSTFGDNGRIAVDVQPPIGWVTDMERLPDGKLLLLGLSSEPDPVQSVRQFSVVMRVNAGGTPDVSFGTNGVARLADTYRAAYTLLVTGAGQIVIAGGGTGTGTATPEGVLDFTLQRLNADGSIDTTFGDGGRVTTDIAGREDIPVRVLEQPDGRLIVVGYEQRAFMSRVRQRPHVAIVRYEADGRLDASFGTAGISLTDLSSYDVERATDAALQPDGRIVVVGDAERLEGDPEGKLDPRHFLAMRFATDGTLDTSFGRGGATVSKFRGASVKSELDSTGRILLGGTRVVRGAWVVSTARLRPNGKFDGSFGRGGVADLDFAPLFTETRYVDVDDMELQPDGKIVVAGNAQGFAVGRFEASGRPDNTFGWAGRAYDQTFANSEVNAELQPDGKILLGTGGPVIERLYGTSVPGFAAVSHRTLVVEGTEGADDILVTDATPPAFRVFSVVRNGYEQRFAREDVDRIVIRAGDDDDSVVVQGQVFPTVVFGGRGNDSISGADGADRLYGEDGNDVLTGGAASDVLNGGPGDDVINALDGTADRVAGAAGNDEAALDGLDRAVGIERRSA